MKRNQTFHEEFIPLLVNGIGAKCYLELGVYDFTTIHLVKARNPECRCIGVDMKRVCEPPVGVEFFEMTTEEFFSEDRGIRPDVVFIDADHNAKAVKADYLRAYGIVEPDGLILLHDTSPATKADTDPGLCGDAWKVAWRLHGLVEAVTLPYHPGLTIVRKRVAWGPQG